MKFSVDAIDTHVQGDHGRVVLGGGFGVLQAPGATMFEKMRNFERESDWFRLFMLREPRGSPVSCVNLVVPPCDPRAHAGFIIMEQQRTYPAMSGTNSVAVATVLLETGAVPITGAITELLLEPPAGLIKARAHCSNGRVNRVDLVNVDSFCTALDVPIDVPGCGRLKVSVAFGGMVYAVVDARALGFDIRPGEGRAIRDAALAIASVASKAIGFRHPLNAAMHAIEGVVLLRMPDQTGGNIRQAPVTISGQIGRTPAGTACSATMAVLFARGERACGDSFAIDGMFDNPFHCRIVAETEVGSIKAIVPEIGARAFITAYSRYVLQEDDPFPQGLMVGDLWSMADDNSPASKLASASR
jgi:proline racemase